MFDHVPFCEFVKLVGRAAFANDWDDAFVLLASYPVPRSHVPKQQFVNFVMIQVIESLSNGIINSTIYEPEKLTLIRERKEISLNRNCNCVSTPQSNLTNDGSDDDSNDDFDCDDGDGDDDDFELLNDGDLLIDREFWNNLDHIHSAEISASRFKIPTEYIYKFGPKSSSLDGKTKFRELSRDNTIRPEDEALTKVYICSAQAAISRMFQFPALPDREWFDRYRNYKNRFYDELVAYAWRYIAVNNLEDKHGVGTIILDALNSYIKSEGMTSYEKGLSDSTLENLVKKILIQWRQKDFKGHVLINSTPYKPKS